MTRRLSFGDVERVRERTYHFGERDFCHGLMHRLPRVGLEPSRNYPTNVLGLTPSESDPTWSIAAAAARLAAPTPPVAFPPAEQSLSPPLRAFAIYPVAI